MVGFTPDAFVFGVMLFFWKRASTCPLAHYIYKSIDDGKEYFYGLIIRKDNPEHDKLIDIFLDFLSDY